MKGLVTYLQQMYEEVNIPFIFYIDDDKIFEANPNVLKSNLIEIRFTIGTKSFKIETQEKDRNFIKIFKFCIENKYKEDYNIREKVIIELLQNLYVSKQKINEIMPVVDENTYLITISVKENPNEALEILKNVYVSEVIMVKQKNIITLVGSFEDIEDHVSSMYETLDVSVNEKCYISYSKISNYDELYAAHSENVYQINLAQKYNLSKRVFNENSLLFEKVVDNLKDTTKESIIDKFNVAFSNLDEETIKTIEVFFSLDLNLSEASKALYVHRNTLIYRLDKIQKYTSYDIRKFNDAVLFKIAFFIWKEKNK